MSLLDAEQKMGRGRGAGKKRNERSTGWAARRREVSVPFSFTLRYKANRFQTH